MHRLARSASHIAPQCIVPKLPLAACATGSAAAPFSSWAIEPDPTPSLPVVGSSARFPVNRIWCVGRNYSEHGAEMRALGDTSGDEREPPFFFLKPGNAIVGHSASEDTTGSLTVAYPPQSSSYHFEVEMCVAIGTGGADIPAAAALDHVSVYGYAVGLDMTRRDLQNAAKKAGRPWCAAKAFHQSAPCSPIIPVSALGSHPTAGQIWLDVNGTRAQESDIDRLTWNVPDTIAALSACFTLCPGDIIMTGTPAGVGPVVAGDRMTAAVEALPNLLLTVDVAA